MEVIFVYLPNPSHLIHFQSGRQKKWIIHNKTNKYRWHFRSKPHQTTSLNEIKYTILHKQYPIIMTIIPIDYWYRYTISYPSGNGIRQHFIGSKYSKSFTKFTFSGPFEKRRMSVSTCIIYDLLCRLLFCNDCTDWQKLKGRTYSTIST